MKTLWMTLVLSFFFSAHRASAQTQSSTVFSCRIDGSSFAAEISLNATREGFLKLTEKSSGRVSVCPLELENLTDGRRGVVPTIALSFYRQQSCEPALQDPMSSQLSHEIGVSLNYLNDSKPQASVFLLNRHAAYQCRITKLQQFDLQLMIERVRRAGGLPLRERAPAKSKGPEPAGSKAPRAK